MSLQKRQTLNEELFRQETFRVVVFETNPLTLARIVNYLSKTTCIDGKPRFHRLDAVKTVREAVDIAKESSSKNPIHLMLLKFEHPTIDEMEVVKSLSQCNRHCPLARLPP